MILVANQTTSSSRHIGKAEAVRGPQQPIVDVHFTRQAPNWIKSPIELIDLKILPEPVL